MRTNSGEEKRTVRRQSKTSTAREPKYHARIKDWPSDERPREKLLMHGVETLSDAELLAIILGSGSRGVNALDLAKTLLRDGGGWQRLGEQDRQSLCNYRGIGLARSIALSALFELSRRIPRSTTDESPVVTSPEDVAVLFIPRLRYIKQERFYVLLLNSANRVIREVEISRGILNTSVVHPREVFNAAIIHKAASVILIHNHPSGNPEPSEEDKQVTRQMVESGRILGLPVHDHIIIAGNGYLSFRSRNLL